MDVTSYQESSWTANCPPSTFRSLTPVIYNPCDARVTKSDWTQMCKELSAKECCTTKLLWQLDVLSMHTWGCHLKSCIIWQNVPGEVAVLWSVLSQAIIQHNGSRLVSMLFDLPLCAKLSKVWCVDEEVRVPSMSHNGAWHPCSLHASVSPAG